MKKLIIILFVLFASLPVKKTWCVWWATEFTQIANNIELVMQLAQQVEDYANQVEQLNIQLQNLEHLSERPMEAINTLQQLSDIIGQGQVVSYAAMNANQQLAELFPGYGEYKNQELTPAVIDQRYQEWSGQNKDSITAVLDGLGIQNNTLGQEDQNIDTLIDMSRSSNGNLQALQAGNLIAAEETKSLQRLRQLLMANSQLQANYMASEQDQRDLTRAKWNQLIGEEETNTADAESILNDF